MSKPVLGLIIGAVLGAIDGISALAYEWTKPQILSIVIGSTFKGLVTGLAAGFFARKFQSLPLGILFGLVIGLVLSFAVAYPGHDEQGHALYGPIMIPGAILGAIVGFATQKFGRAPVPRTGT